MKVVLVRTLPSLMALEAEKTSSPQVFMSASCKVSIYFVSLTSRCYYLIHLSQGKSHTFGYVELPGSRD